MRNLFWKETKTNVYNGGKLFFKKNEACFSRNKLASTTWFYLRFFPVTSGRKPSKTSLFWSTYSYIFIKEIVFLSPRKIVCFPSFSNVFSRKPGMGSRSPLNSSRNDGNYWAFLPLRCFMLSRLLPG